jgi:HD-like signal output (HDOD) protein
VRVLFVDDEAQVLESLQDALRPRRGDWDMAFAPSARAALGLMEERPFDVVVSDVRMPDMDGVALFEAVRARWPGTLRVALTGYADQDSSHRLARVAHQYLAKPTPSAALQETLERAGRTRRLLPDEAVRGVVGRIERLPPRPRAYGELVTVLSSPDSSAADVARVVEREPALVAKLLQLVNSSFFRLARRISRVEDAVVHLGLEQIRSLVLSAEIFQCAAGLSPMSRLSVDQIQRHALLTARIAARIDPERARAGEAFLAGIVHEIGLLVLGLEMPERVSAVVAGARASGQDLHGATRALLGVSGAEVGAFLLGLWGLPEPLLEAVAWYRSPALAGRTRAMGLAGVLHVADALAGRYVPSVDGFAGRDALDEAYLAAAGFAGWLPSCLAAAAEESAAA